MEKKEFRAFRKKLKKTQSQMADLIGTSVRAVRSYEQGWRKVPGHVERQVLFLVSRISRHKTGQKACWTIKKCPPVQKKQCPAWEFQAGTLCWYINGTICQGVSHKTWEEKMKICRTCEALRPVFQL